MEKLTLRAKFETNFQTKIFTKTALKHRAKSHIDKLKSNFEETNQVLLML